MRALDRACPDDLVDGDASPARESEGVAVDLLDQIASTFFVSREQAQQLLHDHLLKGQRSRKESRQSSRALRVPGRILI
jgi:hypothetical protein